MQELQVFGQLVIDFQHRRDAEQRHEAEVDHRVHQASTKVAQQSAHVSTGAEIAQSTGDVLRCRAATIGRAALPVANAISELERAPHNQDGNQRVERDLQGAGDAFEHFPRGRLSGVPVGELRNDARREREDAHANAEADGELVWLEALEHIALDPTYLGSDQPKYWRSRSRMRPASVARTLCASAGTSSSTPTKWR